MPYTIRKAGDKFCVHKKDDGKKLACHTSEDKAKAQVRALYANEGFSGGELDALMTALETTTRRDDAMEGVEGAAASTLHAHEIMPASEAIWTNSDDGRVQEAEIVIVRPGMSKNGRFYTQESIQKAVNTGFWNNSKMFVDHGDIKMPMKRSLRDLVAGVTETWVGTEGEARGRVRFFDEKFGKFAQEAKDHMGVSISMEFKGRRFRDPQTHQLREQVDEMVRNHSVDWVAFPAAGGQIAQFYAAESEDDVDWSQVDAEMLKKHRPDLVSSILASAAAEGEGDDGDDGEDDEDETAVAGTPAVESLTEEKVRQIAQEAFEQGQRAASERDQKVAATRTSVTAQVHKAGLPAKTQARVISQFEGQTEYVEAKVQEAIDSALDELKSLGFGPRVQGLGASAPTAGSPADAGTLRSQYPTMFAFESAMGIDRSGDSAGKGN